MGGEVLAKMMTILPLGRRLGGLHQNPEALFLINLLFLDTSPPSIRVNTGFIWNDLDQRPVCKLEFAVKQIWVDMG